jgi:hexosaminidase
MHKQWQASTIKLTAKIFAVLLAAFTLSNAQPTLGMSAVGTEQLSLMPVPLAVQTNGQLLPVGGGVKIHITKFDDAIIQRAAQRFQENLAKRTGLIDRENAAHADLKIEVANADPNFGTLTTDEAYQLTVDQSGIVLKAHGQTGVIRGLSTLLQLVELKPDGFNFIGTVIDDHPRFAWRGLLLDPARHFISIETLKRQIDAMELVKLNVLHLHLSDYEGFRLESKTFPKLHETASDGQFYTQEQMKDLIAYALDRAVRILPEFDMPGHSGAEVKAYPHIGTPRAGNEPDGILDPSRETTYEWIDAFLEEMTALFPDAYYHMGGDEVDGTPWLADPNIQQFMQQHGFADRAQLQAYFTNRFKQMLDKRGKIMLGWDEVVNPKLASDVLVHSWRSYEATAEAVQAGYPVIVSNGFYTDMLTGSDTHYAVDPVEPTDVSQSDDGRDRQRIELTAEQKQQVIGGEATLWGELVIDELVDARNWPRTAAIAERLWSPKSVRDTDDMYRRLIVIDSVLASLGLQHHANPQRMAARLVPDRAEVLGIFLSAVKPTPHWGHMHPWQHFNELADIASPDALAAKRLELDVKEFLASGGNDPLLKARIAAQLRAWRDNHEAFVALAARSPMLSSALARSQDLRDLSEAGLQALELIAGKQAAQAGWLPKQYELINRQLAYDDATKDGGSVRSKPQPPADLLLAVHPAIRLLLDRTSDGSASPRATSCNGSGIVQWFLNHFWSCH